MTVSINNKPVTGVLQANAPATLTESQSNNNYVRFKAFVIGWDENRPEWSERTSNGVRYQRQGLVNCYKKALEKNGGIPIMYNHVFEGDEADQLGSCDKAYDDGNGLVIEGYLNKNKKRVYEEIMPGFLKNISLQITADDYWEESENSEEDNDTIYAVPNRVLETSFVPVNGYEGAKLLDLEVKESLQQKKQLQSFAKINIEMQKEISTDPAFQEMIKRGKMYIYDNKIYANREIFDKLNKMLTLSEDQTVSQNPAVTSKKLAFYSMDGDNEQGFLSEDDIKQELSENELEQALKLSPNEEIKLDSGKTIKRIENEQYNMENFIDNLPEEEISKLLSEVYLENAGMGR